MMMMYKLLNAGLTALLVASLMGCNPGQGQSKPKTENAYSQVRDRFRAQDAYYFYGRTKMTTGQTANANVVNFSGQKQGTDILMNVRLSAPERKRAETLSILSKNQQMFARIGDEPTWRTVDQRDFTLQQEFNNWNPVFSFQQLDEMKKSVTQVNDRNPKDDIEAVRVLLDSRKLKAWLAREMKKQVGVQTQAVHQPKMKFAMSLSERDVLKSSHGARIQSAETRGDIDEMLDHMELEAEYTIYYNRSQMLPTSMVMNIRSEYDLNDQRVHEHSQVETFLQDYGKRRELPLPPVHAPQT